MNWVYVLEKNENRFIQLSIPISDCEIVHAENGLQVQQKLCAGLGVHVHVEDQGAGGGAAPRLPGPRRNPDRHRLQPRRGPGPRRRV